MLDHQLDICHGTVGDELTTAVQLIAFLKKQISDSMRPKVHEWVINLPCYHNKELASPEQTATVDTQRSGVGYEELGIPVVTTHGHRDHVNLLLELLVAFFELIDIGSMIALRHEDIEDVLAPSRHNPTNIGNVPALLAPINHGHDPPT
ncbi:hypothetical protein Tco_0727960 [Tanacetum coccineum]|uniref:Uncharacterized protein n=1 Tax=Tanacetum coccineum TaxID=301880 RepID=A0ABQ4YJS4_9ASTR